jgi:hypothetical protein
MQRQSQPRDFARVHLPRAPAVRAFLLHALVRLLDGLPSDHQWSPAVPHGHPRCAAYRRGSASLSSLNAVYALYRRSRPIHHALLWGFIAEHCTMALFAILIGRSLRTDSSCEPSRPSLYFGMGCVLRVCHADPSGLLMPRQGPASAVRRAPARADCVRVHARALAARGAACAAPARRRVGVRARLRCARSRRASTALPLTQPGSHVRRAGSLLRRGQEAPRRVHAVAVRLPRRAQHCVDEHTAGAPPRRRSRRAASSCARTARAWRAARSQRLPSRLASRSPRSSRASTPTRANGRPGAAIATPPGVDHRVRAPIMQEEGR